MNIDASKVGNKAAFLKVRYPTGSKGQEVASNICNLFLNNLTSLFYHL